MKTEAGNAAAPVEEVKFPPGIYVESAWQVSGGTSVAAVHAKLEKLNPKDADVYADQTICAIAQYGKGLVMVASFGNMFNDKNLGNDWCARSRPRGTGALRPALRAHATPGEGRADRRAHEKCRPGGAEDQRPAQSPWPPRHARRRSGDERGDVKQRYFSPFHLPSAKT